MTENPQRPTSSILRGAKKTFNLKNNFEGVDIADVKVSFIKEIEDWLNNYPRAMFDYKSSNMVLSEL